MVKITGVWVMMTLCSAILFVSEIMAYRSDRVPRNEYRFEGGRRHKTKHSYYDQRAVKHDGTDNFRDAYASEPLDFDDKPEELPGLVVDYANMIRNDIILLDNSVQTQTRKRANIKVEKYSQSPLTNPPCSCEYNKIQIELGVDYVPRAVMAANCSLTMCQTPYKCQEQLHNISVLKPKYSSNGKSEVELPDDLKRFWIVKYVPIAVGCLCKRDYVQEN